MPIINPSLCYKTPPDKKITIKGELKLDEFAQLLITHCPSKQDFAHVQSKLEIFVGNNSTYTYKSSLKETILAIQAHLNNTSINESEKQVITDKLIEGLDQCAPGFHNRVNSILLGIVRPQSIDDILLLIRISIVEGVARKDSDDVHKHNSFFILAASIGYGVRPINAKDVYSRKSTNVSALTAAFKERYTALSILTQLQTNIESELRTYYGYQGATEGYELDAYRKMMDFLKKLLGTELDYGDVFILDTEDTPCDINWPTVCSRLITTLKDKGYFIFTDKEHLLFDALFNPNNDIQLNDLLKEAEYRALLMQMNHPELFKYFSDAKKHIVAQNLCAKPINEDLTSDELVQQLNFIKLFSPDIEEYSQQCWKIWLSKKNNQARLLPLLFKEKTLITVKNKLLSILPQLPTESINIIASQTKIWRSPVYLTVPHTLLLLQVFSKHNLSTRLITNLLSAKNSNGMNALMMAAYYQPDAIPNLIQAALTTSKPKTLIAELLSTKISDGRNALMLAACRQPNAIPSLIEAAGNTHKPQTLIAELLSAKTSNGLNTLMIAARYQPDAIPNLIKAALTTNKPKTLIAELLSEKTSNGMNALMIAAGYQPDAIPNLIKAADQTDQPQKFIAELLSAKTSNGMNVLMLAAEHQPNAIPKLIEAAQSQTFIGELLSAKTSDGINALMIAARYQPDAIPNLIKAAVQTDQPQTFIAELLNAKTSDGMNALMLAAEHQPNAIPKLIEAAQSQTFIGELLSAKTSDGINALMIAARYQPDAIPNLIEAAVQTDQPQTLIAELLSAKNSNGINALMIAARYQSDAIPKLIEAAVQTDQPQKFIAELLSTKDSFDRNTLMLAVSYQPNAIPSLIEAALTTSEPKTLITELLSASNCFGRNALMLAAEWRSDAIPNLIKAALTTHEPQKLIAELLSEKTSGGKNALMLAAERQPNAIPNLIKAALTTSKPQILIAELLSAKTSRGKNALMLAASLRDPNAIPSLIEAALTTHEPQKLIAELLSEKTPTGWSLLKFAEDNKKFRNNLVNCLPGQLLYKDPLITLINTSQYKKILFDKVKLDINNLDSLNPIENALKISLNAMSINALSKKIAVLDAYNELKKQPTNLEENVKAALQNLDSPLYKALKIERLWGRFFANHETSSLKRLRAAVTIDNKKPDNTTPKNH